MNMGMAEMERQEHMAQMRENDIKAGHKPGCLISSSPAFGGGYCNCGLYPRGVSRYDPLHGNQIEDDDYGWGMYFWGFLSGVFSIIALLGIMSWVGVL